MGILRNGNGRYCDIEGDKSPLTDENEEFKSVKLEIYSVFIDYSLFFRM